MAQLRPGVHSKSDTLAKWAKTYCGKWPPRAHWVYWEEGHWVGSAQTTKRAAHHTPWVKGRLSGSYKNIPGIFWPQKSSQKEWSSSAQSKACSDSFQAPRFTFSRMTDGTIYISIRRKPISQKGDHMEVSIRAPPQCPEYSVLSGCAADMDKPDQTGYPGQLSSFSSSPHPGFKKLISAKVVLLHPILYFSFSLIIS